MLVRQKNTLARHGAGVVVAAVCAIAVACGGPTKPTPPPPPINTAPTVTSVLVNRTQVNAGEEVEVTATAQDDQTAAEQLTYAWSAPGGSFTGQGRVVRWRSPTDGPVPNDYILTVTATDPGGLTASRSSEPVRVNDGIREMRQLAMAFLEDFTDVRIAPELVVRNFTDACPGKARETADIADNRRDFDQIVNVVPPVVVHTQLNSGFISCTYPRELGGRDACALVIASVDWRSRWAATNDDGEVPGTYERVRGDALLTGVFVNRQWRLCDSFFNGSVVGSLRRPFLR